MTLPLHGITVLDLSRLFPGPLCSLFLADLGAEVIKIEAPLSGDYCRYIPPVMENMSGSFALLNRNKKSVTLDLKNSSDKDDFLTMVAQSDVVLESFRPGVMERLGVDYQKCKERNPNIIYCSLTGYGQTGPQAHKAGHDLNFVAETGLFTDLSEDRPPVIPQAQIADVGGAFSALSHILAALYAREKTGEGCACDVSLAESVLPFLALSWGEHIAQEQESYQSSRLLQGGVPSYQIYPCKDGKYVALGAIENKFWVQFLETIDLPELGMNAFDMGEEGKQTSTIIANKLKEKSRDEWLTIFESKDCCFGPVYTFEEVQASPQARDRELFIRHEHPTEGSFFLPRSIFRFSNTRPPLHQPASLLGQDKRKVFQRFGLNKHS